MLILAFAPERAYTGAMRCLPAPFFCLLFAFLCPAFARGEWRVERADTLSSPAPAVTHRAFSLRDGEKTLTGHLVRFDRGRCGLRVVDLAPGASVAEAAREAHAWAGVNGGYFKPDRTPLGLVVSHGATLHPWETAKILTGVLAVTPRGGAVLWRNAEFQPGAGVRDALQAGPFLVDHGKAVAGLNEIRRAERTVLLADRRGVTALLATGPVTLAELARVLAQPGLWPDVKVERALNLDGGSSTALWVAASPTPFSRPEWKSVRNAVLLVPAEP